MSDNQPIRDEKYEGPSKATVAAGRAYSFGWLGTVVGAASGVLISFFTSQQHGKYTQKATDLLHKININVEGRKAIVAGWGLIGMIVGHYVFMAIGFNKGLNDGDKGPQQFHRLKKERDNAVAELSQVKEQVTVLNDTLNTPRTTVEANSIHHEKPQQYEAAHAI